MSVLAFDYLEMPQNLKCLQNCVEQYQARKQNNFEDRRPRTECVGQIVLALSTFHPAQREDVL
jgi:hypothetical protein